MIFDDTRRFLTPLSISYNGDGTFLEITDVDTNKPVKFEIKGNEIVITD